MDAVKSFNQELSSLYEVKPPISKAKMTALTRGAIKAIKFYKHVVQSVEKFILKCRPEYKVPGLYVIDSIVRQSRHQFGSDKDVFAPRFSKNMQQTFINLFKCPPEDKSKIIRVLNLWQKNHVFAPEVIQPLFDLADPNNPIHKELGTPVQQTNGLNVPTAVIAKGSPAMQRTPTKGNQPGNDSIHGTSANLNFTDPNVLQQLQQLQRLLTKNTEVIRTEPVHFDKKLLDFDYGDDDEEVNPSPRPQQQSANDSVSSLLANPEVLRQLQTLQQTMANAQQQEMDIDKMRKLQEMKQQEEEFDKHLAQTVPNLPFAAECEFKPNNNTQIIQPGSGYFDNMNPPPPNYQSVTYEVHQQQVNKTNVEINNSGVEVITLDHDDSRSDSEERYSKRRRSRSRSRDRRGRDRDRDRDRKKRSRSRSTSRRHRSRSRDRKQKEKEKETERDRERKKRGLPTIKKDHLSICSTTLWVGHLSKLVHQDDLSNTFGEFGDVVSIDLIPPRGCAFIVMLRRQDAARCLAKLKGHVLHGKAITLAWAPGKGVKGKDLKDYWEGDLGVSYIPYSKIKEDIDIEMLEDGGMIDEETMPDWMKEKVERIGKKINIDMPTILLGPESGQIDTSQPPPLPGTGLLQAPPPLLPLVSPFQFNNRLLSMNVPPGMMPNIPNIPNIPLGVPPPNMTGAMMPNQLLGIGSPFQGPPTMLPPPQLNPMENKPTPPNAEANLQSLSESLMTITQSFGMIPPAGPPPHHQDDNMDIEMEDAEKPLEKDRSNSDGGYRSSRDDRKDTRREDRDRRNRSRDREKDRERDRDRDRGRDRRNSRDRDRDRRDSRGRDRDRDRDRDRREDRDSRRDRGNRWGDRDRSRDRRDSRDIRDGDNRGDDRRDREKSLNDRLREMAGMSNYDDRDRNRERRDQALRFQPPDRVGDDFDRGPQRNDFSFERGQSMERPEFKEKDVSTTENKSDMAQDDSRDVPSDGQTKNQITENSAPNTQINLGTVQEIDRPLLITTDVPPGLLLDRPASDMMDNRNRRGPGNLMEVMGAPLNMIDGTSNLMDIMDRPPHFMDGPPPHMLSRPPNLDDPHLHDGMMDRPPHMMDRPPHVMDRPHHMNDRPPSLLDGPPFMLDDGPSDLMDGPPDMYFDRMGRRDIDGGRFRGGHRGGFGMRGMRGGPPPDFEYFDNFPRDGPRGPMRGAPNFGPRGGRMLGPRGPRGAFFRGPRGGRGGFRDGPNFNPRFDGPPEDFFRAPGGPRMRPPIFNDGPPRFRGHRFDDRNWDRPDASYENNDHVPPPAARQGRRSRWGNNEESDEHMLGEEPVGEFNRGSATPVFDECPPPEDTTREIGDNNKENEGFQGPAEDFHQDNGDGFQQDSGAGNENFQPVEQNYNNESGENLQNDGGSFLEGNSEGDGNNYQRGGDTFQECGDNFLGDGDPQGSGGDIQGKGNDFHEGANDGSGDIGQSFTEKSKGDVGEPDTE